jgi:hypothetical protein
MNKKITAEIKSLQKIAAFDSLELVTRGTPNFEATKGRAICGQCSRTELIFCDMCPETTKPCLVYHNLRMGMHFTKGLSCPGYKFPPRCFFVECPRCWRNIAVDYLTRRFRNHFMIGGQKICPLSRTRLSRVKGYKPIP